MDRATFNHIVKDAAAKKREKFESFFKSVSFLQGMEDYERAKLADALKEEVFAPDEVVITQGEVGNTFYMVVDGEGLATKVLKDGEAATEVKAYKPGDFFGELALLRNEPRAANVLAKSKLRVASLDRQSFKRLLGPLENILMRQSSDYKGYH